MKIKLILLILIFSFKITKSQEYLWNSIFSTKPLYLTPYIENGYIEMAQFLSYVNYPQVENVNSYSGYLTVNKHYNSNMFFWYFPAKHRRSTAPTILWLQGGFGGSGLLGIFAENGPFTITKNGKMRKRKRYSWHNLANMIYVDNPIGTGYSFTDNEKGYSRNENEVGLNLLAFLKQFFQMFPEIQLNDFYVAGESFGGKHAIALAYTILHNQHLKTEINLKGLVIGNGIIHAPINIGEHFYEIGLVDSAGKNLFELLEQQFNYYIFNKKYVHCYEIIQKMYAANPFDEPKISLIKNLTGIATDANYAKKKPYNFENIDRFVKTPLFRQGIHVGQNWFHGLSGSKSVADHIKDNLCKSMTNWLAKLLSYYKVYLYNGQFDLNIPYPSMEKFVQEMKFNGSDEYFYTKRKFWTVDGELAGYAKHVGNLTTILVRDAGHMAVIDQPKWVFNIIQKMLSDSRY